MSDLILFVVVAGSSHRDPAALCDNPPESASHQTSPLAMDAPRETPTGSTGAQPCIDQREPFIPYVVGLTAAATTPMHPGTVQQGAFLGHLILSGPDNWYCTLLKWDGFEPMMPENAVHCHGTSGEIYFVDEVRCQICDKVKNIDHFSEGGKKRVQRRATRALQNEGSYAAAPGRICCDTCVNGHPGDSAKTQLINMVSKRQIKAEVTISVVAIDMNDENRQIRVEESYAIGGKRAEKEVQTSLYKNLVGQLISRMDED